MSEPVNPSTNKVKQSLFPLSLQPSSPTSFPLAYGDNIWDIIQQNSALSEFTENTGQFDQHMINELLANGIKSALDKLSQGTLFLGEAQLATQPNTEVNGFYIALTAGTYTNFLNSGSTAISVAAGEIALIVRSGNAWAKQHILTMPYIDPTTKHWIVDGQDSGVKAEGQDGTNGVTPHIDPKTGNWFIGETNTGVHAQGQQGTPGQDAVNPFKGWYDAVITGEAGSKVITSETENLPANPAVGDYAYVKTLEISGTTPLQIETPVVKIYECATAGTWSDSDRKFNPAYSQSFQTGQEVNETRIDDTHLIDPVEGSLAKASDVKTELNEINDDIMNVVETKTPIVADGSYNNKYIASSGKIFTSTGLTLYYKYIASAIEIYYEIFNTTANSQNIRIAIYDNDISNIPAGETPQGTVIAGINASSGIAAIPAGKWLAWSYKDETHKADVYEYSKTYDGYKHILSEEEVSGIATSVAESVSSPFGIGISTNERAIEMRQLADMASSIVVDWMKVCHAKEGLNYTGLMNVIESSENSITLTTTDAAHFIGNENGHCPVCVRFSDGLVKVVYFDPYSGNDGVVSRSIYDNTDLTDAVNVQSLHNTVNQGYGIHLSQLGYIMLGQFTAQEVLKVENQRDENLVKGVCFNNLATDEYHPYLDNGKLYSKFGEYICDVSATTAINISTTAGILGDWYLNRCMTLRSATASGNGTLTIPLSARGYFMISCMSKSTTTYSSVPLKMRLYVDGNETPVQTFDIPVNAVQFYTSNYIDVRKELKIVFDSNDTDSFVAAIADFGFIRISPDIKAPIICTETINTPQTLIQRQTTIAVLGDSWTQFPHITDGLAEYSDYNEKVTSPDITEPSQDYHDGFGYFPKELAFRLGAAVDNYGKSGMRSDNWGVIKIDEILSIKHYDYLVVEFFINDLIQKLKPDQWAYNIWLICQKCKAAGTRPIIILACEDNGPGFVGYGNRRAQFLYGLGNATFIV